MRKRSFRPTLEGARLEDRVVLSTIRGVKPAASRRALRAANDNIDTTLPFVVAATPTRQNALNFTTHTYFQMVESRGAGADGLDRLFRRFDGPEDVDSLVSGLARLSRRAPFGGSDLLPIWLDSLAAGGGEDQLRADLTTYINDGVGVSWNVLQSRHHHSTDDNLTINGEV